MIAIDRENSLGFTIRSLSNLLRRRSCTLIPPPPDRPCSGIGGQIMGCICEHRDAPLYQRDLEHIFCIRRSTASHFLKQLEADGLVERRSVPQDARLKQLVPTRKALAIHQSMDAAARELEGILARGLSEEEIAQFLSTARKIQQNLLT